MRKSNWMMKTIFALVIVLAVSGAAYATLIFTAGTVASTEVSPGASAFNAWINIDLVKGDEILGIEVGRDDRSPFVAIVWAPGPMSNHSLVNPFHVPVGEDDGGPTGDPPPPPPEPSTSEPPFQVDGAPTLTTYPNPPVHYRLIYRPTNDPINPGWTNGLGTVPQIEQATLACERFATTVRRYCQDTRAGNFSVVWTPPPAPVRWVYPILSVEIDPDPTSPTYLEFYKYDVPTRP